MIYIHTFRKRKIDKLITFRKINNSNLIYIKTEIVLMSFLLLVKNLFPQNLFISFVHFQDCLMKIIL